MSGFCRSDLPDAIQARQSPTGARDPGRRMVIAACDRAAGRTGRVSKSSTPGLAVSLLLSRFQASEFLQHGAVGTHGFAGGASEQGRSVW